MNKGLSICTLHARVGNLNHLKEAIDEGYEIDTFTMIYAARHGHLDCLEFLHKLGCPWNEYVCSEAAREGHWECYKYASENGCPVDKYTVALAMQNHQYKIYTHAVQNYGMWGLPWDADHYKENIMEWLNDPNNAEVITLDPKNAPKEDHKISIVRNRNVVQNSVLLKLFLFLLAIISIIKYLYITIYKTEQLNLLSLE